MANPTIIPEFKDCEACGAAYVRKPGVSLPQYLRSRACSRSCACTLGHPMRHWPLLVERFWEKVDKTAGLGPKGECWEWTGTRLPFGYGNIHVGRTSLKAHRVAFELHHRKPIPNGLIVRHDCDNPPCVRHDHLQLGTLQDNSNDAKARGRTRAPFGEAQHNAKLTEEQARIVRFGNEPQWLLARRYGVTRGAIAAIRNGRTWKHVQAA